MPPPRVASPPSARAGAHRPTAPSAGGRTPPGRPRSPSATAPLRPSSRSLVSRSAAEHKRKRASRRCSHGLAAPPSDGSPGRELVQPRADPADDRFRGHDGLVRVVGVVLVRWHEVLVAVEGELAFTAEPLREAAYLTKIRGHRPRQTIALRGELLAHVVLLRRIDPDDAEHAFESQLHHLLALPHDVRMQPGGLHLAQERQAGHGTLHVALSESDVGHRISKTSPGRYSRFRIQYHLPPAVRRSAPRRASSARMRSSRAARKPPRSTSSPTSTVMSRYRIENPSAASRVRITGLRSADQPRASSTSSAGARSSSRRSHSSRRRRRLGAADSRTTKRSMSERGVARPLA